jgi:hypothetical protein
MANKLTSPFMGQLTYYNKTYTIHGHTDYDVLLKYVNNTVTYLVLRVDGGESAGLRNFIPLPGR